ncbi:MAG: terminase small subunit [Verrucomicrobia bacterium]|nr:terminase small subunit [Verrucomicrobiota bacterium]
MNIRQEKFCEHIAAGESGTAAYLKAGFKVSRSVARANAHRMLAKADIGAKVAELRKTETKSNILSRDAKRRMLAGIILDPAAKMSDRLRAIEIDSRLAGHFAPDQVTVETGPKTLEAVRERVRHLVSVLSRQIAPRGDANGHSIGNGNGNGHAAGLSRWNPANSEPPA